MAGGFELYVYRKSIKPHPRSFSKGEGGPVIKTNQQY